MRALFGREEESDGELMLAGPAVIDPH